MRLDYSRNDFNCVSFKSLLYSIENPYSSVSPKYRVVCLDTYKYSDSFSNFESEELDALNCLMIAYKTNESVFNSIFDNILSSTTHLKEYIESLAQKYVIMDVLQREYFTFAHYLTATIAEHMEGVKNRILEDIRTNYVFTECVNGLMFFGINKYSKTDIYTCDWGGYSITENLWR